MSTEENPKAAEVVNPQPADKVEIINPEAADDASGKLTDDEMEKIAGGLQMIRNPHYSSY